MAKCLNLHLYSIEDWHLCLSIFKVFQVTLEYHYPLSEIFLPFPVKHEPGSESSNMHSHNPFRKREMTGKRKQEKRQRVVVVYCN